MDWLLIIDIIREHGYLSLFGIMVIGLFFFPVPNEVLLMSGGFLATTYLLDPLPTFFLIYSCILFHGTFLYIAGKLVAKRSHSHHKKRYSIWRTRAEKGKQMLNKYGIKAASFSYFFPFVRHAVPFSMGLSNVSYRLFSLVGFSSAFIWMTIYFFIGFYYGRTIKDWSSFVEQIIYTLVIAASAIILYQVLKKRKEKNKKSRSFLEGS